MYKQGKLAFAHDRAPEIDDNPVALPSVQVSMRLASSMAERNATNIRWRNGLSRDDYTSHFTRLRLIHVRVQRNKVESKALPSERGTPLLAVLTPKIRIRKMMSIGRTFRLDDIVASCVRPCLSRSSVASAAAASSIDSNVNGLLGFPLSNLA
jgi:hypothetical protein